MSVFRLHFVGWLHKSIRSENVLFFEEAKQDLFSIAKPYLCGFDFSRQDSPGEMTENIPTVLLEHYIDVERSHYRHPELDYKPMVIYNDKEDNDNAQSETEHAKDFKYQKKYDVYSLGMVLIEIGLWCPVKELAEQKLAEQKPALTVFRDKLMSRYLPELRYRMGERYYNVVVRCLSGNFNAYEKADETKVNDLERKDIRDSRIWLENFEKEAVSELEKIAL